MFSELTHYETLRPLIDRAEEQIAPYVKKAQEVAEYNQFRVLDAFRRHKVSDFHFMPSTGYGYNDEGRDTLERIYADVFGAEAGLCRPQIISGTHAIGIALFGLLLPGDELLYITGKPYDTLEEIVGIRGDGRGSLKELGVHYDVVEMKNAETIDVPVVLERITPQTKVVGIQRSKGYATRRSLPVNEIGEAIAAIKAVHPHVLIFVDNCYGEFVETIEPTHVGADLMAGSLIKNPGGGLAKTGGYLVGRTDLIERASFRMTTPGIGAEAGPSLSALPDMYQGFYMAPHTVSQALMGAMFTSSMLGQFGFDTAPHHTAERTDLIQSVSFHAPEPMIAFCQAIQAASPVNAHALPIPDYMPGYADDVIMAAGTFVQGSSIELSADGPIRAPYTAYVQGGLTYSHVKIAIISAVNHLMEKQLIPEKNV
ncbi:MULTISPECIES: methionine gamma-lyase family protein [unclassified Exiguobacterium]|uniref:methionine gamma-lyase family protein n=2 Tax=Exiguobacterium TaxID=33986 RepID=UPI001BEB55B8|nr:MULTISPECIES: methionine gamma-lyase family protein [unclassified Exiguobacterium]MDT0171762.1 methionine gamma-lyase family protein [Exiguobacterium sp. BRG2]